MLISPNSQYRASAAPGPSYGPLGEHLICLLALYVAETDLLVRYGSRSAAPRFEPWWDEQAIHDGKLRPAQESSPYLPFDGWLSEGYLNDF